MSNAAAVGAVPTTIRWVGEGGGHLELLDQRQLPGRLEVLKLTTVQGVWEAIKTLAVRGAPAIGISAAYGMVIAAQTAGSEEELRRQGEYLKGSRPTAVNLGWAVDRILAGVGGGGEEGLAERVLEIAREIHAEDKAMCEAIGAFGASLIKEGTGVLTHCNTGILATGGTGTALAIVYEARRRGVKFEVFADETRPLLQGARLTAWELDQAKVPVTLITDSMAALVMAQKKVHLAIVGADRIAANGDTANKIGTYSVATLAAAHGIPFVVAAPSSTFDLTLADGSGIPIEERAAKEITHGFGSATAPENIRTYNPAFDVTPAKLIHSIVTEKGVIHPVTAENIRAVLGSGLRN